GVRADYPGVPNQLGNWNASSNTPSLVDGAGSLGDYYIVSIAGNQNLGSKPQSFAVGEWVYYDGTYWIRRPAPASLIFDVDNIGGFVATTINPIALAPAFHYKGGIFPGSGGTCSATLAAGSGCTLVID